MNWCGMACTFTLDMHISFSVSFQLSTVDIVRLFLRGKPDIQPFLFSLRHDFLCPLHFLYSHKCTINATNRKHIRSLRHDPIFLSFISWERCEPPLLSHHESWTDWTNPLFLPSEYTTSFLCLMHNLLLPTWSNFGEFFIIWRVCYSPSCFLPSFSLPDSTSRQLLKSLYSRLISFPFQYNDVSGIPSLSFHSSVLTLVMK